MHRIFKVTGGTLTLNNMTLKKGKAGTGNGGGVRVGTLGDFTMKNGRITDNVAHHNGKAISVYKPFILREKNKLYTTKLML